MGFDPDFSFRACSAQTGTAHVSLPIWLVKKLSTSLLAADRHATIAISTGGLAVYPLWKGSVKDALFQFSGIRSQLERTLAVAAVLPDQALELNELDALEAAGVLVVEVPQKAHGYHEDELAVFLENEIDCEEPTQRRANVDDED